MKHRLLYFYPVATTFVMNDSELLKSNYFVNEFHFDTYNKLNIPLLFIRQLIFLVINIWNSNLIVCHFAGYHSFLPVLFGKLFNKPSIVIVAGTDCVSFPSIKYGNYTKYLIGSFTRWTLRFCNHICPVHKSLILSEYTYTSDDYPFQGYKFFCKRAQTNFTEIPYGFDHKRFFSNNEKRKQNSFVTVTQSINGSYYYRKGIDLIVSIAAVYPDYSFAIVGVDSKSGSSNTLKNIELIPPVNHDELNNILNKYEFYLQLSICEGFPNALCESMLSGCIPIGSAVAAIPEIIDNAGFILKHKDINQLSELIGQATSCDRSSYSLAAQSRIKNLYTMEKRRRALINVINSEMFRVKRRR